MAHKGKLYPYALQRDLSPPNPNFRNLPQRLVWSGLVCTGTKSIPFNGGPFTLDLFRATYAVSPQMIWQKQIGGSPTDPILVQAYWTLTGDPRFGLWGFLLRANFSADVRFNEIEATTTFPYGITPTVKQTIDPVQLKVTSVGRLDPKPW